MCLHLDRPLLVAKRLMGNQPRYTPGEQIHNAVVRIVNWASDVSYVVTRSLKIGCGGSPDEAAKLTYWLTLGAGGRATILRET